MQYLILCLFIGCPSIIITAFLKITTNQIGGVDPAITFFFSLTSTFLFVISSKSEVRLIRSLIGSFVNADTTRKFINMFQMAYYSSSFIYAIAVFVLNFLPIGLPGIFNGTDSYPRGMIVIFKNVAIIMYFLSIVLIYKVTINQAERILEGYKKSDRAANIVNTVINKLNEEHKSAIKKLGSGIIIYGIFCIPYLWGYATYPNALLLVLSSGKGVSPQFLNSLNYFSVIHFYMLLTCMGVIYVQ